MKTSELKKRTLLIIGFGEEGHDAYRYLRKNNPKTPIAICDMKKLEELPEESQKIISKDNNLLLHLGDDWTNYIENYDVIIKSPGVPPSIPEVKTAIEKGKVTSNTEIFMNSTKGKVIGITGTKGKSTTSSIIYHILEKNLEDVHLVGNIGNPILDHLDSDSQSSIYVYELSSYQLNDMKISPHIAVFLNIFPEHLNYHKTFEEYLDAKANITIHQGPNDHFVYNLDSSEAQSLADQTAAQKLPFSISNSDTSVCYEEDGYLFIKNTGRRPHKVISTTEIPLLGRFNLLNVMPGIIIGQLLGIPYKNIAEGIKEFRPLEHRMEPAGMYKGIKFYNNSIATIPQATIEAINTFGDKLQTIIVGGFDRGLDFSELGQKIAESSIENVIIFPDTGAKIWSEIEKSAPKHNIKKFEASDMKQAIEMCYKNTDRGNICLLSPASPSFTLFQNYKDEGYQFKRYVKEIGKSK
ncbi:UDP-N-acetylmuramoyl-L-alanine--D-glutamate ligase [Candidatus Dojkabacteria bacterium]|nr:UDP-N-acetylmuramoyl-L-alanine--D-glutamate ligase [Candidatus Dojkabacteria bacterium]